MAHGVHFLERAAIRHNSQFAICSLYINSVKARLINYINNSCVGLISSRAYKSLVFGNLTFYT